MELSTKKEHGTVHVRGRRLLRVKTPHTMSTKGFSPHSPEDAKRFKGVSYVECNEGDLAIEVVYSSTGKLCGYSYVSGPAICVMNYRGREEWFDEEPLGVSWLDLESAHETRLGADEYIAYVSAMLGAAKYGSPEICVFRYQAASRADINNAVNGIAKIWDSCKDPHGGDGVSKHLIGQLTYSKTKALVHFQPARHANDHHVSLFQLDLLCGLADRAAAPKN